MFDSEVRELVQAMIIRDGYRYKPHISYGPLRYYQCEDQRTQGCKGVWKIDLNEPGETGNLHIEHSVV